MALFFIDDLDIPSDLDELRLVGTRQIEASISFISLNIDGQDAETVGNGPLGRLSCFRNLAMFSGEKARGDFGDLEEKCGGERHEEGGEKRSRRLRVLSCVTRGVTTSTQSILAPSRLDSPKVNTFEDTPCG
jgi:hypothetical protein